MHCDIIDKMRTVTHPIVISLIFLFICQLAHPFLLGKPWAIASSSAARIPTDYLQTKLRSTSTMDEFPEPMIRIGHGFDIHRLKEGK